MFAPKANDTLPPHTNIIGNIIALYKIILHFLTAINTLYIIIVIARKLLADKEKQVRIGHIETISPFGKFIPRKDGAKTRMLGIYVSEGRAWPSEAFTRIYGKSKNTISFRFN
jgi:NADH:ubiquinone oxidoreductase subunit H